MLDLTCVAVENFIRRKRTVKVNNFTFTIKPVPLLRLIMFLSDYLAYYLTARKIETISEQKILFNAQTAKQFLPLFVENITVEQIATLTQTQIETMFQVIEEVNDLTILDDCYAENKNEHQTKKAQATILDLVFWFMIATQGAYTYRDLLSLPAQEFWGMMKLLMRHQNKIHNRPLNYVAPDEDEVKELQQNLRSIGIMVN